MSWRIYDRIIFRQIVPVIRIGRKRPLQASDALPLPSHLHPRAASQLFNTLDTSSFQRLTWQILMAVRPQTRAMITLIVTRVLISVGTPILLKALLESLPLLSTSEGVPVGIVITALLLGLTGIGNGLVVQHFYYQALQAFLIIVNGVNRRVVEQSLRLRTSARAQMNTGDLVNHLSSDTDALAETSFYVPEMVTGILSTVAVIVLLSVYIGWAAFFAVLTLLALSPITMYVANRYRKLDHHVMELRDERVTLMSQILQGIRIVKYQAWEESVHAQVADVRKHEVATRVKIVSTDALSTALFITSTTVVAFVGFASFVLLGGELTAPLVFACLALFAMLEDPFGMISHLLAAMQHARVATTRLHAFFSAPTRREDQRQRSMAHHPVGLTSTNVSLTYPDATTPALDAINLTIAPGSSVAIVGSVGAGKSTLLRSLAGLHHVTGSVVATNIADDEQPRAAYVPQESFILNASVLDNILFGEEVAPDEKTIQAILDDCALVQDVNAMPAGINTEIGERGVNMSGGQKARLSLARAAMAQPGIVFLDDPLSAVDVETENVLVDRLLFNRWKTITRVVVTHRLAHLHRFDSVVVLDNGKILAVGALDEVRHLIPEDAVENHAQASSEQVREKSTKLDVKTQGAESSFTEEEDRDTGAVGLRVYAEYVRAMIGKHPVLSPIIFIGLLATAAMITVLPILQTSWLGFWSDALSKDTANPGMLDAFWNGVVTLLNVPLNDPLIAVSIFGLLGTFVLTGWIGERLLWLYRSASAGRTIHNDALSGVLAAPIRFFDSTPMGRVLNRFARDQEGVDDHLSWNWEQSFKSLSQTIGTLILVLSVLPLVIFVLIPVLFVYYRIQHDYRSSAREAKRLESVARSPRYAHFKELVTGLDVIHGYGRETYFLNGFYNILANYDRQFWTSIMLNRWFSVRVPLVAGLVSIATSFGVVVLASKGEISVGMAGVVLTYALSFWWNLSWTIRAFSEVESRMTSVERLQSYGSLQSEKSIVLQPALPGDAIWPVQGAIEIKNLSVRYAAHLPLVLNDVSISIAGKSKVGIVGRTGSGKSTLFQALFRFIEAESGSISIDGVNIASVPLQRLRKNISIIPQDPTLFIGTVRSNLDRFGSSTDEELWNALRRVQLDRHVESLPNKLNAKVTEGGANFSQGQRQLLCMARAILLNTKIIVLDEATASVDPLTDAAIQQTIRKEFSDVTVVTIAHRLDTVRDANMIVELANGTVKTVTTR